MNNIICDILVVAEHNNQQIKNSTLHTLAAAKQLPGKISVLVAGHTCEEVANQVALLEGVDDVLLAEDLSYEHGLAENLSSLIAKVIQSSKAKYLLAPATTYGKNILPRTAALLDVSQISEVINIISPDTFLRPIYAGNALATVQALDPIKVLTIRTIAFDLVSTDSLTAKTKPSPITKLDIHIDAKLSNFIRTETSPTTRPELSSAQIIVSGGRGLQSKENFKLVEQLADKLGAAIGASRAAVDAGFVPNDYQVGQTGKVVAPALYIAIGISGAIQHLAGMKDSKVIVAINKDADAPIFQVADYGLVGNLFEILPKLIQVLS